MRVGPGQSGRAALKDWYDRSLSSVGATIHMVGNHVVDLADVRDGRATGVVYCREEVTRLDSGQWDLGMIQYWDVYRLVDRRWLFERRRVGRWYSTEALLHLELPASRGEQPLPEAFATWREFQGRHTIGEA